MTTPRRPIAFGGDPGSTGERLAANTPLPAQLVEVLQSGCPTSLEDIDRAEHGRDWWPLAMHWALQGSTVTKPGAICRPRTSAQVAHVVRACSRFGVALTVAGGRSGVSGAAIPVRGGVVIDTTDLAGVVHVDRQSGLACVLPGTFGPDLEHTLRNEHQLTVGHFPQSFALSTVGGWVASHSSGQYSTRYGTIADMVAGLEVVDAQGTVATYGPHPSSSTGPDLKSLFGRVSLSFHILLDLKFNR
jgi:alkyldihydroxyacetonephosphate synthase